MICQLVLNLKVNALSTPQCTLLKLLHSAPAGEDNFLYCSESLLNENYQVHNVAFEIQRLEELTTTPLYKIQ